MMHTIRSQAQSEEGFTLIELLVVILIIGILAAIAIPSFLNQRYKGQDACAKSMAKQMQTASKTFQTDTNSYVGLNVSSLVEIESSIVMSTASSCGYNPTGSTSIGSAVSNTGSCNGSAPTTAAPQTFCVSTRSVSGNTFSLSENGGAVTRACSVPTGGNKGGCSAAPGGNGTW